MNCNASFGGLLPAMSPPERLAAPLPLDPLRLNPAATVQQQLYMSTLLHQLNPVQNPFFVAQLQLANAFKANQSIFPAPDNKEEEFADNDEVIVHENQTCGSNFSNTLDLTKPRSKTQEIGDNDQSIVTDDEVLDKIKGKDITVSRIQCKDDKDETTAKPLNNFSDIKLHMNSLKLPSSTARSPDPSQNFGRDSVTPPQAAPFTAEPARVVLAEDKSSSLPADQALIMKALVSVRQRKPRGQKKPIPEEMKTARYYERRSRNNRAAKKSRDQRKLRESLITQRAAFLEAENAHFRLKIAEFKKQLLAINMILAERGIDPSAITSDPPNSA